MSFAPLRRRMDTIAEKILHKYADFSLVAWSSWVYSSMNSILKQENVRRDLGIVSWREADHDEKIEQLIDVNDILFERIVRRFSAGIGWTSFCF